MENEKNVSTRVLVTPGELLSEGGLKAGKNTYWQGNKIYASQMGFKSITANYVNVAPLSGRYIPRPNDLVVGVIMSVNPTTWLVDINSPYPAPLHVTEVPWRVDFGETSRFLNTGDTILAKVFIVDEIKRVQVTMKDHGSRRLTGGQIIEISPTKVPRVIGKGGSMISMIKQKTMCRLFVGQNGRIWIDGDPENIRLAVNAVRFIERESHRFGLTEAVERYLTKPPSPKEGEDQIAPEIKSLSGDVNEGKQLREIAPEEEATTMDEPEQDTKGEEKAPPDDAEGDAPQEEVPLTTEKSGEEEAEKSDEEDLEEQEKTIVEEPYERIGDQ